MVANGARREPPENHRLGRWLTDPPRAFLERKLEMNSRCKLAGPIAVAIGLLFPIVAQAATIGFAEAVGHLEVACRPTSPNTARRRTSAAGRWPAACFG